MRVGHGGHHARQTEAMRSEKCVIRCGRTWDSMRVIAGGFPRTLQRCACPTNTYFLLILQEVNGIVKTRNQLYGMLRLVACEVDDITAQITLRVRSMPTSLPCPLCTIPAHRIHSHYERTLADLPWADYRVCVQLRVRKWFCQNPHCVRRIFTERLPTVAAPWARRTLRLA